MSFLDTPFSKTNSCGMKKGAKVLLYDVIHDWHGYAPSIKRHHVYHVLFSGAGRREPFPFWFFFAKMTIWLVSGDQKFQPAVGPKGFDDFVPQNLAFFFKHGSFDDLGSTPAWYIRSDLPRSTHRRWVLRRRR